MAISPVYQPTKFVGDVVPGGRWGIDLSEYGSSQIRRPGRIHPFVVLDSHTHLSREAEGR